MNEKQTQKVIKTLKFCLSNDGTRAHLAGVFHSGEYKRAISTNGYVMTGSTSLFSGPVKDLIINPETCGVIEREYLKVGALLNFDKEKMKRARVFIPKTLPTGKKLKAHFYMDGTDMKIGLDPRKDLEFAIQAQFLKTLADDSTYTVYYSDSLKPVYFDLTGDESFDELFVAMPVKV